MNFLEIKFLLMCIILPLSAKKGKKIFRHNAKRLKSFNLSLSCGRWDLNPHDVTTTRSLVLLVCQFRHFRVSGVSRFCISHQRILIYHTFSCLASTFLNFLKKYFFSNIQKTVDKSIPLYYNISCQWDTSSDEMQKWRNWQTRTVQVRVVVIPWGFDSLLLQEMSRRSGNWLPVFDFWIFWRK